jgi:spoIIIJ-associated protein
LNKKRKRMVSHTKMEFQGKDIADAISKACKALKVPQEDLDIEVMTTGSTGIFGLLKQKARLRVSLKKEYRDKSKSSTKKEKVSGYSDDEPRAAKEKPATDSEIKAETEPVPPQKEKKVEAVAASDELLALAEKDLGQILELMSYPSELKVSSAADNVDIQIKGDFVKDIVSQNGKILDSLQYVMRKMIAKKFTEKVTISIDAGDFRVNRTKELKELGLKLADEVKKTGKTSSIPSLNPSERRVVHLTLQDDKEIRSRSVGDGLFKKVLIYKPGSKGKKSSSRRRKGPRKGNRK